jgi:drug/metabolite transporter (DMT)-like permease
MGVLLCLLASAGFATLGIFGTLAYQADVGVLTLLTVRFALAAGGFSLLTLVVPGARQGMDRRIVLTALGLGCVGYTTQAGLFFGALSHVDVSLLSLLLDTYPAFVTVAAIALGRDAATPRRLAALGAASAGVTLVLAGGGGGADAVGVAMGIGAAVAYTTYILVADTVVADAPPLAFSALIACGAFATFLVVSLASGSLDLGFQPIGWLWLAAIAVLSTIVPVLAFFAGLSRVGPSTASILCTVEPPMTVALALVVFGQGLGPVQLAGGALVLSAVVLLQAGARRPLPVTGDPAADGQLRAGDEGDAGPDDDGAPRGLEPAGVAGAAV